MADKPVFLDATGVAVGAHISGDKKLAARQEEAMRKALEKAHAEGVKDPEQLRDRMKIAADKTYRENVMQDELKKAQEEGITDDTELRYRQMSAANKIKYE